MANFRIETYDRAHLEGMVALYNAETAFEPHIAPLDPQRFIELVEQKSYFAPSGLFVALEGSKVVGWIHGCVAAGTEPWHDAQRKTPRIRMLLFPRDRLAVGNALVAEATAWLEQASQGTIEAMHPKDGYPFYRGLWLGGEPMGTPAMPHVQLVFEVGGYKNTFESIFMTATLGQLPAEISAQMPLTFVESPLEMTAEPMRESWIGFTPMRIAAMFGETQVGSIGWALLPYVADRLGAPCINIYSLGVPEAYQRKGIAVALLARALRLGYAMGARTASVGTQLWNAPAHATYAKLGFRPYCVLIGRERS